MYNIKSSSYFYKFLLFMISIAIISNRLTAVVAYVLLLFFVVFFFLFKTHSCKKEIFLSISFLTTVLFIVYNYQILYYGYNNIYYIQFFGAQVFFIFLISFFVDYEHFVNAYMSRFLRVAIYLIFILVFLDFILLKLNLEKSQLMYREGLWTYSNKPLGLFGQFSVNTTYIVVFYMLWKSFDKNATKLKNGILFFMVTTVILLENSGTGFILYFILILAMYYENKLFKYMLMPLLFLGFIILVQSNLVSKISFNYISFLYEYFYEAIIIIYIQNIHNTFDFLFGIDGNYNFPIDFGPLFMIAKVGFLYFIFYSLMVFYLIYKAPDRYFKVAVFCLLLANIHYPVLFYPILNVLLPLLLIYVSNLKIV